MRELGIFAKFWASGAVKTRLASTIGPTAASALYRVFLHTLLQRLAAAADRMTLVYSPPDRKSEFAALAGPSWSLQPQAAGDLGTRLQQYFSHAFQAGAQRVVVIGSDSPSLPLDFVTQAFAQLAHTPVVLGPAIDGGYYLVGARPPVPPIFAGIAWSSRLVWQQTVDRLRDAGCPFASLPEWYDVDDEADLARLQRELDDSAAGDSVWPQLRQALRAAHPDGQ